MLDCGMDMSSALHFLPLPLVQRQGQHQQRMTAFATKDGQDWGIEGVRTELTALNSEKSKSVINFRS